jgi:hypothetical protein
VTGDRAYATPQAMRSAATDRLRAIARPNGRWTLSELQRQFAYDRLLARLYALDDQWVLKGAVALLARRVSVRHSMDIDIFRDEERRTAERQMRTAAELDLGDWFRFDIGAGSNLGDRRRIATRYTVTTWLGPAKWAEFHVDLVGTGVRMTGVPDDVPPMAGISVPGVDQPGYRAYPLVDHVADKVAAIVEPHGDGRPSTRFRDLIDLTAMVSSMRVKAADQRTALISELERRDLPKPDHFDVPDRRLWESGYPRAARRAVGPPATTLDEALAIVVPFVDPVLAGDSAGVWDPGTGTWREEQTP